jgi:beta-glucanase (GH16 family)
VIKTDVMRKRIFYRDILLFCLVCYLFSCQKKISEQPKQEVSGTATTSPTASFGDCNYDLSESSLTSTGWTKKFDDNFSSGLGQWNIWTGGAFNNELQYYQLPNLVIADGILSIEAKRESATGVTTPFDATPKNFQFTSGRIESKLHFSASQGTPKVRMIARIKLPAGYGMWPAFWSYGDPWPTHGEIDILEARGHEPFVYHTAYWYGRRAGVNIAHDTEGTVTSVASLTDCWHVYEVIWTKNSLTYLLDGQVVDVKNNGWIPNFYRKSERITLNLAVGGAFFGNPDPSTIQTGTMQVDWVKVFTSN